MHMDPMLPAMVGTIFLMLIFGGVLKFFKQPQIVAYLIVGVVVGPHGLSLISDTESIQRLGALGVVLLLFFVGMEVIPDQMKKRWRVPVIGTSMQTLFCFFPILAIGTLYEWSWARIALLTFVISLSSSAVVIQLLQDTEELKTGFGQDMLGVLLVQDLLVIPMMIVIGLLGGQSLSTHTLALQAIGCFLMAIIIAWVFSGRQLRIPFGKQVKHDHEIQVFFALGICFGLSLLTGLLELSTALGAFVGGMLISAAHETQWVHHKLESFKVVFMALFFLAIGMSLDLDFFAESWFQIATIVVAVFIFGTVLNGIVLSTLGYGWRESFYGGSVLAQIGEFSFVLAAVGLQAEIITRDGYQLALAIISTSLLLGPLWIILGRRVFCPSITV